MVNIDFRLKVFLISINLPLAPKTVVTEAILIENLKFFNATKSRCL